MSIKSKAPLTLYNKTAEDLYIFVGDQRVYLHGFSEETFPATVGEAFLSTHKGKVLPADSVQVGSSTVVEKPKTMWIANMTGNPECPLELAVRSVSRSRDTVGRWMNDSIDHPAKSPRPISQESLGRWVEQRDKYGNETCKREASKVWTVPPYQRVEFPLHIGRWFMEGVHMASFGYNSREPFAIAIKARPPGDFEPDSSWSLDELRAYLRFIDRGAELPDDEETVRKKMKKSNARKEEVEFKLAKAKRDILKRLFFRVVDPKGPRLPTREEFMLYMNADLKPDEEAPSAVDILRKAEAESDAALSELSE